RSILVLQQVLELFGLGAFNGNLVWFAHILVQSYKVVHRLLLVKATAPSCLRWRRNTFLISRTLRRASESRSRFQTKRAAPAKPSSRISRPGSNKLIEALSTDRTSNPSDS